MLSSVCHIVLNRASLKSDKRSKLKKAMLCEPDLL